MKKYHVFSDGIDLYFDSEDEAIKEAKKFKKEKNNVRCYCMEFDGDEELEDGNCIYSYGSYPS